MAAGSSQADFLHQLSTANGLEEWGPVRRLLFRVLYSSTVEIMLGVLVTLGYVLMILETDASTGGTIPTWMPVANLIILALYTSEVVTKICVLRGYFFWSALNVVDLTVVVIDVSAFVFYALGHTNIPSLAALRAFRVLKLARGMGVIVRFPQLALMIKGLVRAVTAAFYGVVLLFMILSVWGVCAVLFIHPINQRVALTGAYDGCARCPEAYASVRASMLTFFQQTIAGDSWGLLTIPIIEEAPATSVFFAAVYISIHFTMINVILAVIVDAALKASQEDAGEIVRLKAEANKAAANKLLDMCRDMDEDGSGDLTLDELLVGYESNLEFQQHLKAMDIGQDDMKVVYSILDNDDDGSVSYNEFISELIKMKSHDSHTLLVFIKHQVTEIRKDMRVKIDEMIGEIMQEFRGVGPRPAPGAKPLGDAGGGLGGVECESPEVQGKLRESPGLGAQAEPPVGAGEALRSLREGIGSDLVRFLEELSLKSEMHRQLLSSLPDDLRAPDRKSVV